MTTAKIVEIPEKMEKYFGRGKMLHPDREIVEKAIKSIPNGRVTDLNNLCDKLARDHNTDVTCPMRTGNIVKKLAEQPVIEVHSDDIPYWRVIRNDKLIIRSQNRELSAAHLESEGWTMELLSSGNIKVRIKDHQLYKF